MLLGFIAVLIGFLVILYGRRRRRQFNLPEGAVVYEDLRRGASVSKLWSRQDLASPESRIS